MQDAITDTRPLSMTEAYHVAQLWLAFVGEPTTKVEDPTDGVLQLHTADHIVRVRVGSEPAGQGAVIALLRAATEHDEIEMMMFSPTGYNASALEFATNRGIALFSMSSTGEVIAETKAAEALVPEEEFEPPFAERDEIEIVEVEEEDEEDESEDPFDDTDVEWKACPRCGAKQHPELVQCMACGGDLNARLTLLDDGKKPQARTTTKGTAQRRGTVQKVGMSALQCRSCGSHDIELVHL